MREWCSCGAAVRSWSYRRVLAWRADHVCPKRDDDEPEPVQVPPTGGGSQVELSYAAIELSDGIGFRVP